MNEERRGEERGDRGASAGSANVDSTRGGLPPDGRSFGRCQVQRRTVSSLAVWTLTLVPSLSLYGCGESVTNDDASRAPLAVRASVSAVIVAGGHRFVLSRDNVPVEAPGDSVPPRVDESTDSGEDLSEPELAERLRVVRFNATTRSEYIMEAPNWEAARRALALRDIALSGDPGFPGLGATRKDNADVQKAYCCGTDTRIAYRDNTAYPSAPLIALGFPAFGTAPGATTNANWVNVNPQCTASLIGPSTALSAAHCFYTYGQGWRASMMWGTAPDGQDASGPIPAGYPQAYCHYWVNVPVTYQNSGDPKYDYAVIDFNDPQFVWRYPGYTAGWLGWGIYEEATIEDAYSLAKGFPASKPYWPQIWGQGAWADDMSVDAYTWHIYHQMDASNGDSGRPMTQYIDQGWRLVGTHCCSHGDPPTSLLDRRFDAVYQSYMMTMSDDY